VEGEWRFAMESWKPNQNSNSPLKYGAWASQARARVRWGDAGWTPSGKPEARQAGRDPERDHVVPGHGEARQRPFAAFWSWGSPRRETAARGLP